MFLLLVISAAAAVAQDPLAARRARAQALFDSGDTHGAADLWLQLAGPPLHDADAQCSVALLFFKGTLAAGPAPDAQAAMAIAFWRRAAAQLRN